MLSSSAHRRMSGGLYSPRCRAHNRRSRIRTAMMLTTPAVAQARTAPSRGRRRTSPGALDHQLELVEQAALDGRRQRAELVENARRPDLIFVQLPRRDLDLNASAEELRRRQAVGGQEALQLRQLQRSDPVSRLERADGLHSDARKQGHIPLTQAAHAANFPKLQYHIDGHLRVLRFLSSRSPPARHSTICRVERWSFRLVSCACLLLSLSQKDASR